MRSRIVGCFISIVVALAISSSSAQTEKTPKPKEGGGRRAQTTKGPQVGSVAPDFTLPDMEGNKITLSDFRGKKPVVLEWGSIT